MSEPLKKYDLSVNFLGYWFIGTGSESGAYSDLLTLKDSLGFPYVPGKSLKGIFREAFRCAGNSGWFDKFISNKNADREDFLNHLIQTVFGHDGSKEGFLADELHAEGLIHFSNAELPEKVKKQIMNDGETDSLFTTVQSTAIDKNTGTASEKSLRTIETVIPVHLHAEVTVDAPYVFDPEHDLTEQQFRELIGCFEAVAGLVTEIGGKRRRGFGRCLWNMKGV